MLDYTDYDTRLAGYALVRDEGGRILLSRWSLGPGAPQWGPPGGGIEFGERIADGILREIREETGYLAELDELLAVTTHEISGEERLAAQGRPMRAVQVLHRAHVTGGELTHEQGGSSDMCGWFTLDELADLDCGELLHVLLEAAGITLPVAGDE